MRSGIEQSYSRAKRELGAKRLWVRGKSKVSDALYLKILGLNIKRADKYFKALWKHTRRLNQAA
ncbi:MAG: transposase [Deltaproteobacteria bacterium]|jgi:hypothetical protein|nr:transposase [Deltaproteobacteria bacterium]